ncbi:TetR family transcriptional regulator [Streptomyces sp. JH002]|uniref:TetR family transcriptional regulator n=1 Tax=Streptomyces sp. JH002 TaxID=2763259 RepID=UPI003D80798A
MAGGTRRAEQVSATRDALLTAAERLFAERGVHAVAHRQISEAAGQGNNAAVSYHFGTKDELIRALARRHAERMERIRVRLMAGLDDSAGLREWVTCFVRTLTDHLESMGGGPTWYARFIAQVTADPALYALVAEETLAVSPSLTRLHAGMNGALPELAAGVRAERAAMTRHLIVQMAVERERALATNAPTAHASWRDMATGLIDVIVALWQAPVTRMDEIKANA